MDKGGSVMTITRAVLHALAAVCVAATLLACASGPDVTYTRAGPDIPRLWPVDSGARVISSGYGTRGGRGGTRTRFHKGIDLPAPRGTPVLATASGTVAVVASEGAYGRYIVIDHQGGFSTLYAHLDAFHVRTGDRVGAGQTIGAVGKSGNATGYHLHYEVHRHGQTVDPMAYMPR